MSVQRVRDVIINKGFMEGFTFWRGVTTAPYWMELKIISQN